MLWRNVVSVELDLSPALFENSSLRLRCKLYIVTLCYVAPFCRSFLCNRTSSFQYRRHPVLWRFHLDLEDNVSDFIKCPCSIWARSFLRKNPCHLCSSSSHRCCGAGQCSSNQPALRSSDTSGVLPLWKSRRDIEKEHLPKVDVRKLQTTLSDYLVSVTEKNITENITYLHAQTLQSAVFCTGMTAFCLVFVTWVRKR